MGGLKSFEELDCWKSARETGREIRRIVRTLPDAERYDLASNMRRASRSVTRNIAEGFGRFSYRENIKFCIIARGSLFELIDDVISCLEDKYISVIEHDHVRTLLRNSITILNGYIRYLERADTEHKSAAGEELLEFNNPDPPESMQ